MLPTERFDSRPLAVFLMGPTASGKTELAVELVERLSLGVISVDSAMVYRGMDIGTAKPGPEILERVPHSLIDIREPREAYSAAQFRTDALQEMARLVAQGKTPLLVGGTMLYFRALQQGLSPMPSADVSLRARLLAEAERLGWSGMHARLAAVDPEAAARIHPNDPQRIQRALEVHALTGKPMSELQGHARSAEALPYRVVKLVLAPFDRGVLHRRIEDRFEHMLEHGFEQEVRALWDRGDLNADLPAMRAVGYRQMLKYIQGEYTFVELKQRGIFATRQLAKRQLTWLRREPGTYWLSTGIVSLDEAVKYLADGCRG
jgi:tRNA dimethylallyltransferase